MIKRIIASGLLALLATTTTTKSDTIGTQSAPNSYINSPELRGTNKSQIFYNEGGLKIDGRPANKLVSLGFYYNGELIGAGDNVSQDPHSFSGILYGSDGTYGVPEHGTYDFIKAKVDLNNDGDFSESETGFPVDNGGLSHMYQTDVVTRTFPLNVITPEPTTLFGLSIGGLFLLKKRRR